MSGIWFQSVANTPIAVMDFETTGLTVGHDRVVEASVVRIEPGFEEPKLIYDTLVNPLRDVGATHIHGITEENIADAPTFKEVAGDFLDAISGSVIASYNAYFDMKFFEMELRAAGARIKVPHFCVMHLRPALGIGERASLSSACQEYRIELSNEHQSSYDAMAAAKLLLKYLDMGSPSVFQNMTELRNYDFWKSFDYELPDSSTFPLTRTGKKKSRLPATNGKPARNGVAEYMETVQMVVSDLVIEERELALIKSEQERLGLSKEQIRAVHAQVFSSVMTEFIDDEFLDDNETQSLRRLWKCLHTLGWAPGLFDVS